MHKSTKLNLGINFSRKGLRKESTGLRKGEVTNTFEADVFTGNLE